LLTGLYPAETGVWTNHGKPSDPLPHLTNVMEQAGYRTASFGKQHYDTQNRAWQDQEQIVLSDAVSYFSYAPQYAMDQYDVVQYPGPPYKWIFGGRYPESIEHTAEYSVVQKAKDWLAERPSDKPFLLQLSFNAPHTPVSVPAPFDKAVPEESIHFAPETERLPDYAPDPLRQLYEMARSDRLTPEQVRKTRHYYYGLTAFVDHLYGDLLGWMRQQGLLDNTIVVFVADHGAHLGDFGMYQKQTFFNPALNVPFFFWYPQRVAGGVTLDTPVSTTSLLPTVMALAGVELPERVRERSLADALTRGKEPKARPVFSGHTLSSFNLCPGELNVAVRDGDWKFSSWDTPKAEGRTLVNLRDDPHERRNRVNDPACRDVAKRLTAGIADHLAAGRSPDPNAV
jgi:choline-sulfatase